jgi:hypothetical protein
MLVVVLVLNILKNYLEHSHSPDNISNLNPKVYPSWWGNKNSEDDFSRSLSKSREEYKHHNTEVVFVPTAERNIKRSKSKLRSKSKPRSKSPTILTNKNFNLKPKSKSKTNLRIVKNNLPVTEEDELNQNLKNVESKIKSQVIYDRYMHNASHRRNKNVQKEWRYQDNVSVSNHSSQTGDVSARGAKNKGVNYMISYDKNLKPETIKEKSKEKQVKKNTNKNNIYNAAKNINPSIAYSSHIAETANFNEEKEEYSQKIKNLLYNNNNNISNSNSNRLSNKMNEDISFKKQKSISSREEDEAERLSSYAPSERTKSILNIFIM